MVAERIRQLLPKDWPVVIGDLPATNDTTIGIVEYDGATSTEYFGTQQDSSVFAPIVKIVFRGKSYLECRDWAQETKTTLHRYHDDVLLSVLMVGSPRYLGRSAENLHTFQIVFKTQVKE